MRKTKLMELSIVIAAIIGLLVGAAIGARVGVNRLIRSQTEQGKSRLLEAEGEAR